MLLARFPSLEIKLLIVLKAALFLYVLGHFTPFDEKVVSQIFYIGIIVPVLFLTRMADVKIMWQSPLIKALLVFLVYVSAAWLAVGENNYIRYSLYVLFFMMGAWLLLKQGLIDLDRLAIYFYIAATLFVLIGLGYTYLTAGEMPQRPYFRDWVTENPIHICGVLAIACIACSASLVQKGRYGLSFLVVALTAFLMFVFETRSGYLAILAAATALFLNESLRTQRIRVLQLIGLLVLAILALSLLYGAGFLDPLLKRGLSYRPAIWSALMQPFGQCNLLFGCGYDYDIGQHMFTETRAVYHPHSVYVSQLFFSGLLGLAALLLLIGTTIYVGFKSHTIWLYAFIGGCVFYTVNGYYALRPPRNEIWLTFWIAMAFVNAHYLWHRFEKPRY